jgi:hypothetical protein
MKKTLTAIKTNKGTYKETGQDSPGLPSMFFPAARQWRTIIT